MHTVSGYQQKLLRRHISWLPALCVIVLFCLPSHLVAQPISVIESTTEPTIESAAEQPIAPFLHGGTLALLFAGMLLGGIFAFAQVQSTDLWLSGHFAALSGIYLILSGAFENRLAPAQLILVQTALPGLMIASGLCMILFAYYFLRIPRQTPVLSFLITKSAVVCTLLLPLSATPPFEIALPAALMVQQLLFLSTGALAIFALKMRDWSNRLFLLAWIIFLVGNATVLANNLGAYTPEINANIIWISTLLGMILTLGFAFAQTTRQFDRQLKYRQKESNKILQREVAHRTAELNAMTDAALTARAEAVKSKEIAEAASHAKSEFLAMMSHEIRTPINGVLGMTDLLKDTQLNEQQQHYLDTIHGSARNLLTILDDVLNLGKIDSKHMVLQEHAFRFDDLIEDTLSVFIEHTRSSKVPLYLFMDGLLPTTLHGDPVRLQQILVNLLSNAFKFTDAGHIGLFISFEFDDPTDPTLKFTVSDTGIGVDLSQRDKLFAPFSQADASTSRRFGGTGLGLAICKNLIDLMGGAIDVERNQSGGANFWFRIPLTQSLDKLHQTHFSRKHFDKVTITLLSHDPLLARSVCQILVQINITPQVVHTTDALEHCLTQADEKAQPSVLLVDKDTLEHPFDELHQRLKNLASRCPRYICLLSTLDALHRDTQTVANDPSISHLDKPITLKRLTDHLSRRLPVQSPDSAAENAEHASPWRGLKILVAEDNRVNQLVVKGMLKKLDVLPQIVDDGHAVVAAYCAAPENYDLIFMDCEMPGKDGFAATSDIRTFEQQGQIPTVPIVALSAHALPEHIAQCLAAGMSDHIAKPVNQEKLEQCFQTYFPLRSIA